MSSPIFTIGFWLCVGLGIGAIVGVVLHCRSEFDRRMTELDMIIEELNDSATRCAEARDRLTDLTVKVYQQLKEGLK